jgi:hypothetical protein
VIGCLGPDHHCWVVIHAKQFLAIPVDVQLIRLPPKSPNLNAFAERFVRSVKEECLNQMIFFGHASLRRAIQFLDTTGILPTSACC